MSNSNTLPVKNSILNTYNNSKEYCIHFASGLNFFMNLNMVGLEIQAISPPLACLMHSAAKSSAVLSAYQN